MIKINLLVLILIILIFGCKSDDKQPGTIQKEYVKLEYTDTPDSLLINGDCYTVDDLSNMTPEFLRYARNEIFARKGYVFEDSCLVTYFNHQDWYKPVSKEVNLSESENKWIKTIKNIEANYDILPPMKLLNKFQFQGRPLYYIATNTINSYDDFFRYCDPYLFLLDSSYMWTLKCENLAPEYLIILASEKAFCQDEYIVEHENLRLINFDSACINGDSPEIIARLYGPSNDDEHQIFGFDKNGEFKLLIHSVYIQNSTKLSDSIISFQSTDRCDRIGTEFCRNEYYFNSIERTYRKITPEPYQHTISTSVIADSVLLFSSPTAARKKVNDSIAYTLYMEDNVKISHFLDKDWVYFVENNNKVGWVDIHGLNGFFVSFAD